MDPANRTEGLKEAALDIAEGADIIIEVYNEAGQKAIGYMVYRWWVSEFKALPDLDAKGNEIAIQSIKLENEGWERDYEVAEPTEPSFTEPAS